MSTIVDWDSKAAYSKGDLVRYYGGYYRATQDIGSRTLFSNDAPDSSSAWLQLTADQAASLQQSMLGMSNDEIAKAVFISPVWSTIDLSWDYLNPSSAAAYQPRYVNPYWSGRAQSPLATSAASRLQLAQQQQRALQSQLSAQYAALAAQTGDGGMAPKINGVLCGFADYFGTTPRLNLIGALPKLGKLAGLVTHIPQKGSLSHGVTVKTTPHGNPISSFHVNNKLLAKRDPKAVQKAALLAAKHAQTVAKNTLATVDKLSKQKKSAPPKHVVGAAVHPSGHPRPTTAHHVPGATLSQLKQQAQALTKSADKLVSTVKDYKKKTDAAKSRQKSAVAHQKTVTHLHGIFGDDLSTVVGVDDPTDPNYNPPPDSTTPASAAPTAVSQVPGPPDYGAGPTPTPDSVAPQPEIDYVPSTDLGPNDWAQFYTSDPSGVLPNGSMGTPVPLGAIYFDGSRPLPHMGVGNATNYYGTLPDGTVPKGGAYSGYSLHGDGKWWLLLQGPGGGYGGGRNYDMVNNPDNGMIAESQKNGWGPLIGAPTAPGTSDPMWTNGLRFDCAKMAFFWPYDLAPDWAQAPAKQAAFNAAVVAWKAAQTAGQADYVAAQLQDKVDAQTAAANTRQQAQQDIALAMNQQQFDQQQAQQQAALDLASQQEALQEQAQQAQMDAADAAMQQQQAQFQLQMQQAQLQEAQQQDAADAAAAAAQGGGYGDGGGYGFVPGVSPTTFDSGDGYSPEADSDQEAAAIEDAAADGTDTL